MWTNRTPDRGDRRPVPDQAAEVAPAPDRTETTDDALVAVWARALAGLADGALSPQHRAFLRLTRPMASVGDTVLIAAPNDFARDVITTRLP